MTDAKQTESSSKKRYIFAALIVAIIAALLFFSHASAQSSSYNLSLPLTGVDGNGNELGGGVSDSDWRLVDIYNERGNKTCHDERSRLATTVTETSDDSFAGRDYNGNYPWSFTDGEAMWIGLNQYGRHQAAGPGNPFGGYNPDGTPDPGCKDPSLVSTSSTTWTDRIEWNTFVFELTNRFDIDSGVDMNSLQIEMTGSVDNYVGVRINPTPLQAVCDPGNAWGTFKTEDNQDIIMCETGFSSANFSAEIVDGTAPFKRSDNRLRVYIKSSYSNVGMILNSFRVTGEYKPSELTVNTSGLDGNSVDFELENHSAGNCGWGPFTVTRSRTCTSSPGFGIGWDDGLGIRVQSSSIPSGYRFVGWDRNSDNWSCDYGRSSGYKCVNIPPGYTGSITANFAKPPPTCTSEADRPGAGQIKVRSYNTETSSQAAGATFRDVNSGANYTTTTTITGSATLQITGTPQYYTMGSGTRWRGDNDSNPKRERFTADQYFGYTICLDMEPTWQLNTDITSWRNTTGGAFEPLEPHQGFYPYEIVSQVCNESTVRSNSGSQARHELRITRGSAYVDMGPHRVVSGDGNTNGTEENNVDPDEWRWNSIFLNSGGDCSRFESSFNIDANELPDDLTNVEVCFRPFARAYRRDSTGWTSGSQECFELTVPRRPFIRALGNDVHAGSRISSGIVAEDCILSGSARIRGETAGSDGARGQYAVSASGRIDRFGSNNDASSTRYTFGSNGRYDVLCRPDLSRLPATATDTRGAINNDNRFDRYPSGVIRITPTSSVFRLGNPGTGIGNQITVNNGHRRTFIIEGDVLIRDNLTFASNTYNSKDDIPALAIVATGNITIARDVSTIDAYLVSMNGVIDTCDYPHPPSGSANGWARECRNQLTVNGAIVANELLARRTSGDTQSDTPAEIFRFRPELYLAPPPGLFGTAREIFDIDTFIERPPIF